MGTTVTTNLSLIKPDTDESIKATGPFVGWAAQNAANMDTIDTLFRASVHTWAPNWTAESGGFTLGSGGFVEGKYLRLWPKMVIAHFRLFVGGAGFAPGTGKYRMSLPFFTANELNGLNFEFPIGKAAILDFDTVANCSILLVNYDITLGLATFRSPGGNYFQPTNPFTLAQNDRVSGYFVLPVSS